MRRSRPCCGLRYSGNGCEDCTSELQLGLHRRVRWRNVTSHQLWLTQQMFAPLNVKPKTINTVRRFTVPGSSLRVAPNNVQTYLYSCSWLTKALFCTCIYTCINISTEESQTRESEFLWVSTRPLKRPSKSYIKTI